MQRAFQSINIPKLPVLTAEEGIKQIKQNLNQLEDWKEIYKLVPDYYFKNKKLKRTGIVGIFAASLELTKEGLINMMQKKMFEKILIKKNNSQ